MNWQELFSKLTNAQMTELSGAAQEEVERRVVEMVKEAGNEGITEEDLLLRMCVSE